MAILTLVIVLWNNEIVFKVKHDRHNNHFVDARSGGRVRGEKHVDDYYYWVKILYFRNVTLFRNVENNLRVKSAAMEF